MPRLTGQIQVLSQLPLSMSLASLTRKARTYYLDPSQNFMNVAGTSS